MGLFAISARETFKDRNANIPDRNKKSDLVEKKEMTSLFVPYWTLGEGIMHQQDYDKYLYFGITATQDGVSTNEPGYKNLSTFIDSAGAEAEKLLVLRMLDSKVNFDILKDTSKQEKLINQTINVAKEYGFDGIVLNLELSALPFDSLIKQINSFNSDFFKISKSDGLSYFLTIYGDVYYRIRPFDVKNLAENSDRIMIMAYDFSKANGNPGPNFPLQGKEKYGYDYTELVNKLIAEVQAKKIEIIFGLYGYDWQVDNKNIAQLTGKSLSHLEIKNSILNNCDILSCSNTRDNLSKENVVTYIGKDGKKHTVWYEDLASIEEKKNYLKSKGIYNFSLWANSYF